MFTGKNHVNNACCPAKGLTMAGGSLPAQRQPMDRLKVIRPKVGDTSFFEYFRASLNTGSLKVSSASILQNHPCYTKLSFAGYFRSYVNSRQVSFLFIIGYKAFFIDPLQGSVIDFGEKGNFV